ncbi:hypothetical protein Bca101_081133 [Brassica carinata]
MIKQLRQLRACDLFNAGTRGEVLSAISPPFEGIDTLFGDMLRCLTLLPKPKPVPGFRVNSLCPYPTCHHFVRNQGVCACPECEVTLFLVPVSLPMWKLNCSFCSCTINQRCYRVRCDSAIIEIDSNTKTTHPENETTLHQGCVF